MSARYEVHIPSGSAAGGGGGGGQDRFAPAYLVGNTQAGDSAVAYDTDEFRYYPDTGNGAQLAVALSDAAASPNRGLVYVRRGTYNFGLAGGPAAPLAIVGGVEVCGEGDATIIMPGAVNQGVFTMASTAALKQVHLESAPEPTSLGSTAMVVATGNTVLEDVSIVLGTDAAGALRQAVTFTGVTETAQVSNLRVRINTATGGIDPTIGIVVDTILMVQMSNVVVIGGDIAIDVIGGGNTNISNLLAYDWAVSAARTSGSGSTLAVRQGACVAGVGATVAVAFDFTAGNAHTLVDVDIINAGLQQVAGVRTGAATTLSGVKIQQCRIAGFADAVLFGSTIGGGDANNAYVTDCQIEAGDHGIRLAANSVDCFFTNNHITVSPGGSPPLSVAGIRIEGSGSARHTVDGNSVSVTPPAQTAAYGIQNDSQQTRIVGNEVVLTGGNAALYTVGERNVVEGNTLQGDVALIVEDGALYNTATGNVCYTPALAYANAILVFGGDYGVCSNNVTVVPNDPQSSSPGIQLTAASSNVNCIGNVCRGSSVAPIVDNLGTNNNVSQNIGAA